MKSLLGKIHNVSRLRWSLLAFVFALGTPALALVYYSLTELQWETFHQQRNLAIELTDRINFKIYHWVEVEEQRAYSDYQFIEGGPAANYFQPSPLSSLDFSSTLPGAIGFFQIGTDGEFSSPILPGDYVEARRYGISSREYKEREALREGILKILLDNQLLQTQQPPPAPIRPDSIAETEERVAQVESYSSQLSQSTQPLESAGAVNSLGESLAQTDVQSVTQSYDDRGAVVASAPVAEPEVRLASGAAADSDLQRQVQQTQFFDQRLRQQKQEQIEIAAAEQNIATFEQLLKENTAAREQVSENKKDALNKLAFDTSAQLTDTKSKTAAVSAPKPEPTRTARKEQSFVELQDASNRELDLSVEDGQNQTPGSTPRVTIFESEIYPFEFSPLNSGHLVFFRKVWREGALIIQGLVLDRHEFLQQTIGQEYRDISFSNVANLTVHYRGNVMASYRGSEIINTPGYSFELGNVALYSSRLVAPFSDIEVLFTVNQLPTSPGALVVRWSAVVMALVLALGTWLLYRLGLRQMRLVQQQQDFVSAVSHELKTPLTSIRMYGEMLRQGWADEEKKRQYYDYIYDESERLSRLIANVLQLARMNRKELDVTVKTHTVGELVSNLRAKLHSQVERSGFEFEILYDQALNEQAALADGDSFLQVFINLMDNAIKFSAKSERKRIELAIAMAANNEIVFSLRDYGPGISKAHLNKIFDLFYRAENELTRETVGTGIGLALVNQLVHSMKGRVEVSNCEPGAEFRIFLKCA